MAYAYDATLISDCLETHTKVLQLVDQQATDLDLSFKPSKCVSYLFDGTRYLKKWLILPRSATCAVLYYPGVCCPSISQVSRQAKLSLLSCISASSDYQLQELGLQLCLGDTYLQLYATDHSILSQAHSQLTSFPTAHCLYSLSKRLIAAAECSSYDSHLDT